MFTLLTANFHFIEGCRFDPNANDQFIFLELVINSTMLSRSKSNPASQQRINDSFLLNFLLCPVDPDNEGIQKHRTRISRISNTQRCPGLGGYSENGASEARNTAEEKSEESVTRCEMSQIILPTDDIDPADVYFTKRNTFVEIL